MSPSEPGLLSWSFLLHPYPTPARWTNHPSWARVERFSDSWESPGQRNELVTPGPPPLVCCLCLDHPLPFKACSSCSRTHSGEPLAPSCVHPHFLRTYCLLPIHFGSWGVGTINFNSAPPSNSRPQAQGGVIYSLFNKHGGWIWCFSDRSSWSPVGDVEPWRMWHSSVPDLPDSHLSTGRREGRTVRGQWGCRLEKAQPGL